MKGYLSFRIEVRKLRDDETAQEVEQSLKAILRDLGTEVIIQLIKEPRHENEGL